MYDDHPLDFEAASIIGRHGVPGRAGVLPERKIESRDFGECEALLGDQIADEEFVSSARQERQVIASGQ